MIINSISIQNFGPHKNTVVNFSDSATAIVGNNGSGKSFLMEAVPACFFGVWPSRGNLADGISQGFTGDAIISIKFEIDGKEYLAERKMRKTLKTCTQDAYLSSGETPIAGPKVTDFEQAVTNLIGDGKVFFASAFSAQGGQGDIVECKPTDRKKILGELLCLDRFQEKSDAIGDKKREVQSKLDAYHQTVSTLADTIFAVEEHKIDDLVRKNEEKESYRNKRIVQQEKLENEIKDLTAKKNTIVDTIKSREKLATDIKRKETEIESARLNMKNQVEIQFKGADIEASQALRAQRIAENQEIQEKNQKAMAIKESNAKIHAYVMSLEKQMEKIDDLHKLTDCDYNSKVRELEKQIEILTTGNFPTPDCKTCPFVSSAFQAQEELKTLIKPVHEMSEINSLKAEIVSAEEQLEDDQKILFLVQVPEDRTKELESVLVAGEKIAGYQRDIARITKELEEMQKEYSSMTPVNDSDILYKIAIIGKEKEILARDIASIGDETNALRQEIANMRAIMKQNEEIRARIEILKKENENNVRLAKIYDYLQRAFGRNGIQALLIDTAIPSLQAVSDELIQIATDGRMRIAFSTQKDLKDGRTAESLEIIATDDRGSRDVSTFSGGEQKILRTVIRLTLAIFQSQQAKRKLETMMIDEAFDALDADNAGNLLNVLSKVSDYFKKVVFISHSDEFLAEFPNKIMLKKRDAGTEITKS